MSRSVELARTIRDRVGTEPPSYGVLLGHSLGHLESAVGGVTMPCALEESAPADPHDAPRLTLGHIEGQRVALFAGQPQLCPGDNRALALPLQVLAELGCDRVILAAPAASLRADMAGGGLMLVGDHIAVGPDPLAGLALDGPLALDDAHDPGIRADLRAAGAGEGFPLPEGVLLWRPGRTGPTPAEAWAAAAMGADAATGAIVPQIVLARLLGLRTAALAAITHVAAAPGAERLSSDLLRQRAPQCAARLALLLRRFLRD